METKTAGQKMAEERAELLAKIDSRVKSAQSENRNFTPDEEANSKSDLARVKEITARQAAAKSADELMAAIGRAGAPNHDYGYGDNVGYDGAQVKSGLVRALRQKSSYGFNIPFVKAAVTAGSLNLPGEGTQGYDAPPGTTAVALRDLLDLQTTASGNIRYYVLDAGTGADVVPEGGLKPELAAGITPVDTSLDKIAVRFTYTDELAEDANFLVAYINREATRSVLLRENQLITDALAAATGALTSTGLKADVIDVIATAIGQAEATNGITPTRIIANPLDVAAIRTLKSSGSGEYAIDPLGAAPSGVHGVPLVPTAAIPAGTIYLTSPGVGAFYAHSSGLRVESGFSTGDWEHNRVTTRVEERVLPAIVRPTLLTKVTLTDA